MASLTGPNDANYFKAVETLENILSILDTVEKLINNVDTLDSRMQDKESEEREIANDRIILEQLTERQPDNVFEKSSSPVQNHTQESTEKRAKIISLNSIDSLSNNLANVSDERENAEWLYCDQTEEHEYFKTPDFLHPSEYIKQRRTFSSFDEHMKIRNNNNQLFEIPNISGNQKIRTPSVIEEVINIDSYDDNEKILQNSLHSEDSLISESDISKDAVIKLVIDAVLQMDTDKIQMEKTFKALENSYDMLSKKYKNLEKEMLQLKKNKTTPVKKINRRKRVLSESSDVSIFKPSKGRSRAEYLKGEKGRGKESPPKKKRKSAGRPATSTRIRKRQRSPDETMRAVNSISYLKTDESDSDAGYNPHSFAYNTSIINPANISLSEEFTVHYENSSYLNHLNNEPFFITGDNMEINKRCSFCWNRQHNVDDCSEYPHVQDRIALCETMNLCIICLNLHLKGSCPAHLKKMCTYCGSNEHNSSLCQTEQHLKHCEEISKQYPQKSKKMELDWKPAGF